MFLHNNIILYYLHFFFFFPPYTEENPAAISNTPTYTFTYVTIIITIRSCQIGRGRAPVDRRAFLCDNRSDTDRTRRRGHAQSPDGWRSTVADPRRLRVQIISVARFFRNARIDYNIFPLFAWRTDRNQPSLLPPITRSFDFGPKSKTQSLNVIKTKRRPENVYSPFETTFRDN